MGSQIHSSGNNLTHLRMRSCVKAISTQRRVNTPFLDTMAERSDGRNAFLPGMKGCCVNGALMILKLALSQPILGLRSAAYLIPTATDSNPLG